MEGLTRLRGAFVDPFRPDGADKEPMSHTVESGGLACSVHGVDAPACPWPIHGRRCCPSERSVAWPGLGHEGGIAASESEEIANDDLELGVSRREVKLSDRELPPDPSVLLNSLRGIGYSVEDAVADIVDNSVSAGASRVAVRLRDTGTDVVVDISDNGAGLTPDELRIALTLGATERDPGLSRRERDLGRFGLGLKTASFSVAQRLSVFGFRDGTGVGAAWDLDQVAASRKWLLSELNEDEQQALPAQLEGEPTGTVVRWSRTVRLGISPGNGRTAAIGMLEERLRRHLGMVYHRFIDGIGADDVPAAQVSIALNGRPVAAWNPLVPFSERPQLVQLGEVRIAQGIRIEYAVLPPDAHLCEEERLQATLEGRRLTDMQGFYVYRGNRLVCFANWLGLPGTGGGRWNKEPSTQLARIAVDLTNADDEEWSLDVRKSRVAPPERVKPVLVEVGTEARARSRARIFGRKGGSHRVQDAEPLPSLWTLGQGRLEINRAHPLVVAATNPTENSPKALRAAARSLLRQLETSPSLAALLSEPNGRNNVAHAHSPNVLDDADFGEVLDLGRCLHRNGVPLTKVLEIAADDPRFRTDPAMLERLRTQLEGD